MAPPDPSTVRIDGPWVHRDVSANGIRMHVAELGSGPPVLLLHGFGQFWWAWHHQLRFLADAGFRAIAADLRGYGDSDKPPRGYDAWTLAGDIAGLVRALGERRAHLVGHAWGGLLAWTAATLHPRAALTVSVLGGAHPMALRAAATHRVWRGRSQARALGPFFRSQVPMAPERWLVRDSAAAVQRLVHDSCGTAWRDTADFAEATRAFRHAMLVPGVAHSALEYHRWAFRSQFRGDGRRFRAAVDKRSPVPVLQLHGEEDSFVLPATARDSAPWLGPRSRFALLPGIGHYPHLESPEETGKALLDFLA